MPRAVKPRLGSRYGSGFPRPANRSPSQQGADRAVSHNAYSSRRGFGVGNQTIVAKARDPDTLRIELQAASARGGEAPGSYSRHWWPVDRCTVAVPLWNLQVRGGGSGVNRLHKQRFSESACLFLPKNEHVDQVHRLHPGQDRPADYKNLTTVTASAYRRQP